MFYLEDENTDLIMGSPLETETFFMIANEEKEEDRGGKDPAEEKARSEDDMEEKVEEGAEAKGEAHTEEEVPNEEVIEEETHAEESDSEPAEEVAAEGVEAKDEAPTEEEVPNEEVVEEETHAEEVAEAKIEEAVSEEPVAEESPLEEDAEEAAEAKDEESGRPKMDPEDAAYLAQQTNIFQATYSDMRKNLPEFRPGDKVSVGYRVIEGERSRIQNFDGIVIKISSGHGIDKTFTVRKVSSGIGVERVFPIHSPNIESIKVLKHGKVRRAKLYYLRSRVGKATRIKNRTSQ